MVAVDDGLLTGNFNFADFCLIVALVLFAIALVIRLMAKPMPIDMTLVAGGLTATALALLAM